MPDMKTIAILASLLAFVCFAIALLEAACGLQQSAFTALVGSAAFAVCALVFKAA